MPSIGNRLYVHGSSEDLDRFIAATTIIDEDGTCFSLNHLFRGPRYANEVPPAGTRYGTCAIECEHMTPVSLRLYFESVDFLGVMISQLSAMHPDLVFGFRFMNESDWPAFSGWQVLKGGELEATEYSSDVQLSGKYLVSAEELKKYPGFDIAKKRVMHQVAAARETICYHDAVQVGLETHYREAMAALDFAESDEVEPEDWWRVGNACGSAVLTAHDINLQLCIREYCTAD